MWCGVVWCDVAGRFYFADRPRRRVPIQRIGTRVSLPPLAVAKRMKVTVEEGAESDSETNQW